MIPPNESNDVLKWVKCPSRSQTTFKDSVDPFKKESFLIDIGYYSPKGVIWFPISFQWYICEWSWYCMITTMLVWNVVLSIHDKPRKGCLNNVIFIQGWQSHLIHQHCNCNDSLTALNEIIIQKCSNIMSNCVSALISLILFENKVLKFWNICFESANQLSEFLKLRIFMCLIM